MRKTDRLTFGRVPANRPHSNRHTVMRLIICKLEPFIGGAVEGFAQPFV